MPRPLKYRKVGRPRGIPRTEEEINKQKQTFQKTMERRYEKRNQEALSSILQDIIDEPGILLTKLINRDPKTSLCDNRKYKQLSKLISEKRVRKERFGRAHKIYLMLPNHDQIINM